MSCGARPPRTSISWSSDPRRPWWRGSRMRSSTTGFRCSAPPREPPGSRHPSLSRRRSWPTRAWPRPVLSRAPRWRRSRRPSTSSARLTSSRTTRSPPARAWSSPPTARRPRPTRAPASRGTGERSLSRSTWTDPKSLSSASPTGRRSCRCSLPRTLSEWVTATRDPTRAAWAPTVPCPGCPRRPPSASSTRWRALSSPRWPAAAHPSAGFSTAASR